MREVNRDARRMVGHATLVIDAEAAPEYERVLEIHFRQASLAGWEIRTGQCRVVRADPAAERDLQRGILSLRPPSAAARLQPLWA